MGGLETHDKDEALGDTADRLTCSVIDPLTDPPGGMLGPHWSEQPFMLQLVPVQ